MADDLKKQFYHQIKSIKGLHAIVFSDTDGVPVLKVADEKTRESPEFYERPGFLSTFPLASDLAGKLGFGKNEYFVCGYEKHTIVQFNIQPLTISLIADESTNTGLLLNLGKDLATSLEAEKLRQIVNVNKD